MLCGPDAFFKKARHIMLWDDEDDEDALDVQPTAQNLHCSLLQCPTSLAPPGATAAIAHAELSPCSPLDAGWEVGPLSMGVSVAVLPPSTVANKILKHCKDGLGKGRNQPTPHLKTIQQHIQ